MEKAKQVAKIINDINGAETFLSVLGNRSDDFTIYYRDSEQCELEPECVELLIEHYRNKIKQLVDELANLK